MMSITRIVVRSGYILREESLIFHKGFSLKRNETPQLKSGFRRAFFCCSSGTDEMRRRLTSHCLFKYRQQTKIRSHRKSSSMKIILVCMVSMILEFGTMMATQRQVPSQYSTIQSAINAASPGDTIAIANGTYNESVSVNKSVTLLGASSSVTITPTNGIGITVTANNVLLQSLRVTRSLTIGISASNASNLSLVNVLCDSNKTHGLSIGSGCSNVTVNGGSFDYNGTSRGEGDGAGINVYASGSVISNIFIKGTLTASNNTTAGIWLDANSSSDHINTVTIGASGSITLTNNGGAGVIVLGNVNGATITGNFTKGGALAAGIVIVGLDFNGTSSPINTMVRKCRFNTGYADTVPAISLSTGGYPYSFVNYISIKPVTADSNTFVGSTSDSAIGNVIWDYNDDKIDGLGLVTLTNNNPLLVLSASATSLAFGNRVKNDSATLTAYLRNASTSAMTISSITTSTTTFSATSGSTIVAGGDSTVLTVKFKPASFGTFIDTVKVVFDGGTVKVALSGSSPIPTLTSLKASIAYGNVAKSTTKKDTIKVVNSSINTLIVDSIYTKTSVFTVDRISGTVGTDTLAVAVSFMPIAIANYRDTVYLRNNSTASLVKIPLSGNSPAPTISCNQRAIAFGDVGIYDSAKSVIKVANSSVNILTIDSIYTHSMVFMSLTSFSQATMTDTAMIVVRFEPVKFGIFTDTLFLRNNSDTTLFRIPISGNTPASSISITPSSIAFGTVSKDTTRQLLFTITNSSISVLQIDSLWTQTKYFNVTHMLAVGQVTKGDTTWATIRFTPDSARAYVDTMFIANSSPISPLRVPLGGNGTLAGVEHLLTEIPSVFSLKQNYPNPFNPSTTIQYGLPVRSTVRLVIYNMLGQVVKEMIHSEQQAGYQSFVWNTNVASGIYFYRIETTSREDPNKHFAETKKMLLLR